MKKITLIILLHISTTLIYSQTKKHPLPIVDGKINYTEVVAVENNTKNILYGKAKLWFVNSFKSSNDVIQFDDKESGVIVGKGLIIKKEIVLITEYQTIWNFTIKIQVKEAKYKSEIYDISFQENGGGEIGVKNNLDEFVNVKHLYKQDGTMRPKWEKFSSEINEIFNNLSESIKKAMLEETKTDDF